MKKRNSKKGFTLVELVIVIAVIAILASVLIPTFGGIIDKANQNAAMQEARNIYAAYVADFDYVKGADADGVSSSIEYAPASEVFVCVGTNEYVKVVNGTPEAKANGEYIYETVTANELILTQSTTGSTTTYTITIA